jgi:hypothetical protein
MTAAPLIAHPAALAPLFADLPVVTDPALVRQKSRDFFWYSPVLKAQLHDKCGTRRTC